MIEAGQQAPDFRLVTEDRKVFTQDDLDGETTVLAFYPFAFSGVCTHQLTAYHEARGDFELAGVRVYGVSCDALYSQHAFREHLGINIPLLSDFEPKGEVCRAFGVYHPGGFPQRAVVAIGPDREVIWSQQSPSLEEFPAAEEILANLR